MHVDQATRDEIINASHETVHQDKLSDSLNAEIGHAIVCWNKIEWEIDACIAYLLMPLATRATAALTKTYSSDLRRNALKEVYIATGWLKPDTKGLLKKAVEDFGSLISDRNTIAHGRWKSGTPEEPASATDFLGDGKIIDENNLANIIRDMEKLLGNLRAAGTFINLDRSGL